MTIYIVSYKGEQFEVESPRLAAKCMVDFWLGRGPDPLIRVDAVEHGEFRFITQWERAQIEVHVRSFRFIYRNQGVIP